MVAYAGPMPLIVGRPTECFQLTYLIPTHVAMQLIIPTDTGSLAYLVAVTNAVAPPRAVEA